MLKAERVAQYKPSVDHACVAEFWFNRAHENGIGATAAIGMGNVNNNELLTESHSRSHSPLAELGAAAAKPAMARTAVTVYAREKRI